MKYRDLISEQVLVKLIACSFKSPTLNKNVFDFYQVCHQLNAFIDNEKMKLCDQYGEMVAPGEYKIPLDNRDKFYNEYNKWLDSDIEDEIPKLRVDENSFDDDKCVYPRDKYLWMNAKDISEVTAYVNKQT